MNAATRIVYGASCTWWESISEVATKPSGLPCCPTCGSVLFEMPSETEWWAAVDDYATSTGQPDYRSFIEWARGRCFPDYATAQAAYRAETGGT